MQFAELQDSMRRARRSGGDWTGSYRRANELLAQYKGQWLEPFTRRFRVHDVLFHAGRLAEIVIDASDYLEQFDSIATEYPTVLHVHLRASQHLLGQVVAHPMSKRLASLSLEENALKDEDAAVLFRGPVLPALRWLSLAFNDLTEDSLRELARATSLPALEILRFGGNRAPDPTDHIICDAVDGSELRRVPSALGLELERYAARPLPWLHVAPKYGLLSSPLPIDMW